MSTKDSTHDPAPADDSATEVEAWVREHTSDLLRFAAARVKEREVAEDLLQLTLMAAWTSRDRFAQQSSPRTWLFSILKNKIADHYRKAYRDPVVHGSDLQMDDRFQEDGHWAPQHRPGDWDLDEAAEKEAAGKLLLSPEEHDAASGMIDSVRRHAQDAAHFDKKTAKNGSPYFALVAKNGEPIGISEMYRSTSSRDNGIGTVRSPLARLASISATYSISAALLVSIVSAKRALACVYSCAQ